ncbi:MAG: hypothetical protein BMS9Abin32_035 [Gammaproteobacteria bacterium]|nr:MAG: hypothetical protein BMS9Abin32_035 [Gammaproteobacteria bacterium]
MSARHLSATVLLTIAAAGTWYLANSLAQQEIAVTSGSVAGEGFYLRSARVLGTDDSGQLLYSIEAEYAEQFGKDAIEFRNVRIQYSASAGVPWTLAADTAWIGADRRLIELSGNVTAVSNNGFSGRVTEIRTPYLTLAPDTFRAETDQRVQIRIGSRSLTATGMLALLRENKLQLKTNIRGKFVP